MLKVKSSVVRLGLIMSSVALTAGANASTQQITPIVGGTNVSVADTIAKRTVGLFFISQAPGQTTVGNGVCTGSILDDSRILTAAHCIRDYKQGVVVFATDGLIDLVKKAMKGGISSVPQVRLMVGVKQEPGYANQEGGDDEFNDLAVITFQGGLPAGYEPAKFLPRAGAMAALKKGANVTLSGYGITSKPVGATQAKPQPKTTAADPNLGVGTLRKVDVKMNYFSPKSVDIFVSGSTNHDACSGDSGGPSMITLAKEVYVVGVASRSDCVTESIYTFVNNEIVSGL